MYNPDLSSVVVTGPGFAMDGLSELAQDIWSIKDPLRFGLPYGVEGEKSIVTNPANIALMGALRWITSEKTKQHLEIEAQGLIQRQLERLRGWLRKHF